MLCTFYILFYVFFFFFFKQKTAYEMRISDWSSDVCSSDLSQFTPKEVETRDERQKLVFRVKVRLTQPGEMPQAKPGMPGAGYVRKIGSASCRERVCQYV